MVLSALVGAAAVALVVWQWERLTQLPAVLRAANWAWIAAAVLCQALSVTGLARLQLRLLNVGGRRHPYPPVLATTYAGNAISVSLPLVGSTASAVFSYRRFQLIGAEKTLAAWSLAVAGLFSTIAYFTLSSAGALMSGSVGIAAAGLVTMVVGVFPATTMIIGLQRPRVRAAAIVVIASVVRLGRRLTRRSGDDPSNAAASAINRIAEFRLGSRDIRIAARFALVNRMADVVCLVCALQAVGVPIPWHAILLVWAAGAGTSTLGLTPGGLGVVEAALSLALIAAGVPAAGAISGVLLYRFIKLWLVFAAGTVTLVVIRSRRGGSGPVAAREEPDRVLDGSGGPPPRADGTGEN